jgi:hypothetical protein
MQLQNKSDSAGKAKRDQLSQQLAGKQMGAWKQQE